MSVEGFCSFIIIIINLRRVLHLTPIGGKRELLSVHYRLLDHILFLQTTLAITGQLTARNSKKGKILWTSSWIRTRNLRVGSQYANQCANPFPLHLFCFLDNDANKIKLKHFYLQLKIVMALENYITKNKSTQ